MPNPGKVLIIFVIVFVIAGIGLYLVEHAQNPRCGSLFDAYWMTTVFFLSGFEDFGPVTTAGRVLSLFMFTLGLGAVAAITGKIASIFVLKAQRGQKMPKDPIDHIAICNWNNRGDRVITEIHAPQGEPETEIIVVTDKEVNEAELRKSKEYQKVYFIKSDPTLHSVLESARVHMARSVIILADDECADPDAKTALIALAITKLEKGQARKPQIVAEVINHRKIGHLRDAGVDEWICATDYGLGIIAQCALAGKLSAVYQQLLTYSADTNEIYIVSQEKTPDIFIEKGMSFDDALTFFAQHRDPQNPAILLGVKRDQTVILNPRRGEFESFKERDELIVMAFQRPDLSSMK